ncbi:polyribonucleotide nucleotidyltransferase [Candidatus Microgenomates bacterium]|nr:polyribonucleotide nucleotidyltransferase [Candidatus Microgenomates bacterium]
MKKEYFKESVEFAGRTLTVEFGKLAKQADAALTVRYGDTTIFASVVSPHKKRNEDQDFLPLTVDYEEKMYAAGKISGSRFIKREGRPSEDAILNSRVIDRPIRPLFPKGYFYDVQVIATALSYDQENNSKVPAMAAVSLALSLSDIPWNGPVSLARVGMEEGGQFILNPTETQLKSSPLDLVIVSTAKKVIMIECAAKEVPQGKVLEAIKFAHEANQTLIKFQENLIKKHGLPKRAFEVIMDEKFLKEIEDQTTDAIEKAYALADKVEMSKAFDDILDPLMEKYKEDEEKTKLVKDYFDRVAQKILRNNVLEKGKRIGGRSLSEIRPISCETSLLPRVHGSALFNRGYTQILNVTTLGSKSMAQVIDSMEEDTTKRYMHHYNFPPFSTGEAKPLRSAGRREIGHGALAEKALLPVLPSEESFPYTIRLVSEAMSSDGSTSMGSTCASTLSLMDAGVPIKAPVSGIAMGLVTDEKDNYKVLSDIAGTEDHHGDMDFKIAGTKAGITAIQLDVKNDGLTMEMIKDIFSQGEKGRLEILEKMLSVISEPRKEMSPYAPRMETIKINPDKIRDIIGPGGKIINKIIAETGAEIDIEQDGSVFIFSANLEGLAKAKAMIENLVEEPEIGKTYDGTVTRIMDFGAFVAIMSGQEGLVHISEIANERVNKVEDYLKVGQEVKVYLKEIDDMGRLNFSMKKASEK